MIRPLTNSDNTYEMSSTLGYEKTEHGYLKFRFEFRPAPGFWLDSDWFVPSTSDADTIRLITRFWDAKTTWNGHLREARIDLTQFFQEFNRRVSLEEHIT